MADTTFKGPLMAPGSLLVESGTAATIQPMDGPSGVYQGLVILDPRGVPFPAEGTAPGRAAAYLSNASFWAVDNKPQASNATALAASAAQTSLVPMPLATTQVSNPNAGSPFIAVGVPFLPAGTTVATTVIALDFGFSTGTTTANSSTVAVFDNTKFTQGQWIAIGGAGNANQATFFTQVQTIGTSNTTTITVSPLPPASTSSAPIGQSNLFGATLLPVPYNFGPGVTSPNSVTADIQAGFVRVHNPLEQLARNVSITLATGGVATAVNFIVYGFDLWHMPMTELITVPATTSATTAYGAKAFKYIAAIVPQSASTGGNSYGAGIGDVFGMPMRADEWEQTEIYWAGTASANSTGFTAAVTTTPATNTTGDVRGTIQVGADGKGSAVTGTLSANGTSRLAIIQDVGVWNVLFTTPNNTAPMFGVAQSTT
jgi:hypothetical protein